MRFNIISKDADGLGFALRLQADGNDVRMHIQEPKVISCGDGMIDKVGDMHDLLEDIDPREDVFIFDVSGEGIFADSLREKGYPVLGGSIVADKLERDRLFGAKAMTDSGIKIPKTTSFTSFEDAKKFVSKSKARLVYKPSGALGDLSMSRMTVDSEDLIDLLTNVENEVSMASPQFELQEFHEGVAFSTEAWFDGRDFLPLFNHTIEHKELMNDNIGPSGGCSGNVVWACDGECPCCKELRKLRPFLEKEQYHGMIDLNAIVAEDGIFGLEWTPRFGYDASPTLFWTILDGELGHFFADVARRQYGSRSPQLRMSEIGGGLRLTIPPYPTHKHEADANVPILGWEAKDEPNIYWGNVRRSKTDDSKLVSAGGWGLIAVLTGNGESIASAMRGPLKLAEKIKVSDGQYRTDLSKVFQEELDQIEASLGKELVA